MQSGVNRLQNTPYATDNTRISLAITRKTIKLFINFGKLTENGETGLGYISKNVTIPLKLFT